MIRRMVTAAARAAESWLRGGTQSPPTWAKVYLGAFATSVNEQRRRQQILIPVHHVGTDDAEFADLYHWCQQRGCQLFWDRVIWDALLQRWESNGIGGADLLFIISPDEDTAFEALLTWSRTLDF
jgi:hypothetical protein